MNITIEVLTPAYGWNTPLGIDITASNLLLSTSSFLIALWALDEPNKTPSGTIDAHLPPTFNILINAAMNNNSVLVVDAIASKSFEIVSFIKLPENGGLAIIRLYFPLSSFSDERES